MKSILSVVVLALATIGVTALVRTDQNSSDLMVLQDKLISAIQLKKPEWTYNPISAIEGSAAVVLMQWTLDEQSVRISIVLHQSVDDAAKAIWKLGVEGKEREKLQDLGDGGLSWGQGTVTFRRRDLTISVSAVNTKPTLDPKEGAQYTADERKLNKEFATLVANILKD
jgi:hypothetical protein